MSTDHPDRDGDHPHGGQGEVLLAAERLVVGHAGRALLPPIDLEIRCGEFLMVLGRNGAGKSTFFRTVLGLLRPVSGTVKRRQPEPRVAYVPQVAALDSILPMAANELTGWGRLRGWSFLRPFSTSADRAAVKSALITAHAGDLGDSAYRQLSAGQRQRVLFARMLASDPELGLLDEPTAAMDMVAERDAMAELAKLSHDRHIAVVVVTHHMALATQFADKVLFVDRDDQHVVAGTPQAVFADAAFQRRYGQIEAQHAH